VAHAQTPKHLPGGSVVLRCQLGFDNEAQPGGSAIKWPGSEKQTSRDVGVFIGRSAFGWTAHSMSREEPKSALFVLELGELYRHRSVSSAIRQFVTG
jgi:hypothetical protein